MGVVLNVLKGILIGVANIVPGVSGGTVAFLLGIYDKLIESVGNFITEKEKRQEYSLFLIQIGLGMGIGIVAFAKIISFAMKNYAEMTQFFILGLIIASIPFIFKNIKEKKNSYFIYFIIGFLIMILFFVSEKYLKKGDFIQNEIKNFNILYLLKLFFAGVAAATAMVLPGISGSYLMILMGEYYNILGFINNKQIIGLIPVGVGAVIGIVLTSKIISKLLKKYPSQTLYFILGLVIGSIFKIWPNVSNDYLAWGIDAISLTAGITIVWVLEIITARGRNE